MKSNPFAGVVDYMEGFYAAALADPRECKPASMVPFEDIRIALDNLAQRLGHGLWPQESCLRLLLGMLARRVGFVDIRPYCVEAVEHINRMPSQAELSRRLGRAVEVTAGPGLVLQPQMLQEVVTVVLSVLAWSRIVTILQGINMLEGTPGWVPPELVPSPDDLDDDNE